jgi:hypothetical protein
MMRRCELSSIRVKFRFFKQHSRNAGVIIECILYQRITISPTAPLHVSLSSFFIIDELLLLLLAYFLIQLRH